MISNLEPQTLESGLRATIARWIPTLVFTIGIFLTVVVAVSAKQQLETSEALRLEVLTERIRADATEQMGTYVSLVRSGVGFFEASELQVSRRQFQKFLSAVDLKEQYPGVLSLGFIRFLKPEEKEKFVAEQRTLTPGFEIRPEGERPGYYVATYLEPSDASRSQYLGFDPATEAVRRIALEAARDTATPTMTGRLILKSEQANHAVAPAFILYAPIYRTSPSPLTLEHRREQLFGFVSASFRVDDLLKGIRGPTSSELVAFRIFAGPSTDPRNLLMATEDFPVDAVGLSKLETISIAGFPWTFEYRTLPGFEQDSEGLRVLNIFLIGLLLSTLLFGLTSLQARARRSDARALHYERQRAKDLQDLDQAKTRFFSNLSHELRTPLNGILGMTDLLWDTNPNEQQKDYLTTVGNCGKTLLDLITDVLDVSKIEAGKLELKNRAFRLRQPFTGALEVVRGQAQGKGLELHLDWDDSLPKFVDGDLIRIRQVFVNLLSNAVKFTNSGSVTVRTKKLLRDESVWLEVQVEDTGIGISEENIPKLFRPFSQVTAAEGAETVQGTGLGLVICKELIELMKGNISIESELRKGTVFRIAIPLKVVDATLYESVTEPTLQNTISADLRLLVADDNPVNLRVLLLQLHKLGYEADGVDDGQKAVEALEKKEYDLILMDCQMPRMDGLEATRQIRSLKSPGPVIVALTAHAQPEQQVACKEAGMDDFLTKPIELARLVGVLEKWQSSLNGS